jgi:hypothetical protein
MDIFVVGDELPILKERVEDLTPQLRKMMQQNGLAAILIALNNVWSETFIGSFAGGKNAEIPTWVGMGMALSALAQEQYDRAWGVAYEKKKQEGGQHGENE